MPAASTAIRACEPAPTSTGALAAEAATGAVSARTISRRAWRAAAGIARPYSPVATRRAVSSRSVVHVAAERLQAGLTRVAQVPEAEHVLGALQQRVVVVRGRVRGAGLDVLGDQHGAG